MAHPAEAGPGASGIVQLALARGLHDAPELGRAPLLTDVELIRKIEFFEALEPKVLKQIAEMCIVREFSAGEYIVRQGESGLGLYFITSGKAKVEIERNESKIVVAELKEGDSLGEFSIIDEKARSANVICLEETRCLLLTRDSFSKVMRKHPEIANQMLRTLVGRIRNVNERITNSPAPAVSPSAGQTQAPGAAQPEAAPAPETASEPPADLFSKISGYLPPMPSVSDIPHPSEVFKLYTSTKTKTREYLNEMIGTIYAMKAMMRFSMAIVGCPVSIHAGTSATEVIVTELNGVKILLFPCDSDQPVQIDAYDDGMMHATFYQPQKNGGGVEVTTVQGPVVRDESYHLLVPVAGAVQPQSSTASTAYWKIERNRIA
jgi:CRP/FNR family cyclic AMP-dependent transcriptional regulator